MKWVEDFNHDIFCGSFVENLSMTEITEINEQVGKASLFL